MRRGIVADRVMSGGLRRQLDTAAPYAAALGLEVSVDDRWDEYDDRAGRWARWHDADLLQ